MKAIILGLSAILSAASPVFAQTITDTPSSAVPPSGPDRHAARGTGNAANGPTPSNQAGTQANSMPPSKNVPNTVTVPPAPSSRYNSGTSEVGNSSEANGMPGQAGAAASATMQAGHTANQ